MVGRMDSGGMYGVVVIVIMLAAAGLVQLRRVGGFVVGLCLFVCVFGYVGCRAAHYYLLNLVLLDSVWSGTWLQ